jgi:DUF1680 family protein
MSTPTPDAGLPVSPTNGTLSPLGLKDVAITGGFWAMRQDVNARASIDHCQEWVERSGWVANFDAALNGTLPVARRGPSFADSDVYKLIEAMAWEIGRTGDTELDDRIEALVDRIEPVQESDGYLNTSFGRPGQAPRYSDLEWGHELYSYGHLLQAAVARGRTTGEDRLVRIARRVADHVCEVFGAGGIQRVCGHPEIEVALVEFGRHTGEQRYIAQAALFIERRGHGTLGEIAFGPGYFQDDVTVRDTTVLGGHSVRALYLAAATVDVATETADGELLAAVTSTMATTIARRTYITGGMGAHHEGESFGLDYELPPDRAYSETCAGVGSIMVAYRLLLETGDAHYADLIERTLYNVVAASPSEDGRSFFYANTLHQREAGVAAAEHEASHRAASSSRAPWFDVSCCPTNVARTLASLDAYVATSTSDGVQIHQYAVADVHAALAAGDVQLRITTDYPNDGLIRVEVLESPREEWELTLRVPEWAVSGASVTVDGESHGVEPGSLVVKRSFATGEVIELSLPIVARFVWPDERVDAVRGQVAVERGPLVLCLESTDLADGLSVNDVRLAAEPRLESGAEGTTLEFERVSHPSEAWPYGSSREEEAGVGASGVRIPLVPYHSWANRGPSTMRVWLPTHR